MIGLLPLLSVCSPYRNEITGQPRSIACAQRVVGVHRDGGVGHLQQRDVVARIAVAGQVLEATGLGREPGLEARDLAALEICEPGDAAGIAAIGQLRIGGDQVWNAE